MTIETTTNRISYTGSGTTGPFSFPYYFLADGDLTVIKTTIADGTESTLTLTTDYTVSGAGEAAGGSVTLVATLSSSYKLTIIRDPDILQPADYPANDRFPAATHEQALDRATMIMQRLKDYIDRSFRLSDGDVSGISLILSNLAAGELIAVNAAGTGIESIAAVDVDLTTVSAFIQTLFNDADAATARTTLGAAALGANTFTGLQTFAAGADIAGLQQLDAFTIASGATVDLGTSTGNTVTVTHSSGTTAITSLGGATIKAGTVVKLITSISGGTLTMTHHATNLLLPDGANITFTNGDAPEFVKMHDTNSEWKMVGGQKVLGGMWSDGYTSAVVATGSAVSLTTNTQTNVTSLSLGPGDWDVSGVISFKGGATTVLSYLSGSLSSTSATLDQTAHRYSVLSPRSDSFNQVSETSYAIGTARISLTSTTTIYLVAMAGFTTSTCLAYGGINARRIK